MSEHNSPGPQSTNTGPGVSGPSVSGASASGTAKPQSRPSKPSEPPHSLLDTILDSFAPIHQDGQKFIEQEDGEKTPTMFSVYGHLIYPGGVMCLEDFATHRAALAWMKKESARCKFELGYEDFWEHGAKEQKPSGEELWLRRR